MKTYGPLPSEYYRGNRHVPIVPMEDDRQLLLRMIVKSITEKFNRG